MRIFLMGGTGYIGSHVVRALVARGDELRALARSDDSAARVSDLGAEAVRGDLADAVLLRAEGEAADATVNLAVAEPDGARTAADALAGSRRYVHAGGVWSFGNTHGGADDAHPLQPPQMTAWRTDIERDVLERGGVVVMPAVVYGEGGGLVPDVFGDGRYVGNGEYHVALVHVEDVADAFLRALDAEPGARLAAVAQSVEARAIAQAMHTGATSETLQEAQDRLGAELAEAMTLDQRVTAVGLRALGWAPAHRDALAELGASR